jgi:hypothetical protein
MSNQRKFDILLESITPQFVSLQDFMHSDRYKTTCDDEERKRLIRQTLTNLIDQKLAKKQFESKEFVPVKK